MPQRPLLGAGVEARRLRAVGTHALKGGIKRNCFNDAVPFKHLRMKEPGNVTSLQIFLVSRSCLCW